MGSTFAKVFIGTLVALAAAPFVAKFLPAGS